MSCTRSYGKSIADPQNILQEDLEGRKIHKTNKNRNSSTTPFDCSIPLIPCRKTLSAIKLRAIQVVIAYFIFSKQLRYPDISLLTLAMNSTSSSVSVTSCILLGWENIEKMTC